MRAKKSLGQNFLNNKAIIKKIVEVGLGGENTPPPYGHLPLAGEDQVVLEIGPGKGALTKPLLESGAQVIAIETDGDLVQQLSETFAGEIASEQLILLHGDITDFDINELREHTDQYSIVANIPYYLTGLLVRKFLEADFQPTSMTFIMQKEVVDRIVARDEKESMLSMSVQAYGTPKYHGKIAARYFTPKPKVDSAIIKISNISKDNFKTISEETFFIILRAGFAHKRKKLLKNLKEICDEEILQAVFHDLDISVDIRAEKLTLSSWFAIAEKLKTCII